ncbi:MAG: hypothetical protein AAGN35_21215 [Bacteroidota bacterium]
MWIYLHLIVLIVGICQLIVAAYLVGATDDLRQRRHFQLYLLGAVTWVSILGIVHPCLDHPVMGIFWNLGFYSGVIALNQYFFLIAFARHKLT